MLKYDYLHRRILHLLKQRRHRSSHLFLEGRISGKQRIACNDVLSHVRICGQLLHHGLSVRRVEHVLHQLRVLSHLLEEGLHSGRREEGPTSLTAGWCVSATAPTSG